MHDRISFCQYRARGVDTWEEAMIVTLLKSLICEDSQSLTSVICVSISDTHIIIL